MDQQLIIEEKKDRGFTLVELLIVIVILGILATVTVFAVRGITDKGQESACAADLKTFEVAVESWYALPPSQRTDADGDGSPSAQDLVDTELVRSTSANVAVGANGAVTAAGDCAAP